MYVGFEYQSLYHFLIEGNYAERKLRIITNNGARGKRAKVWRLIKCFRLLSSGPSRQKIHRAVGSGGLQVRHTACVKK